MQPEQAVAAAQSGRAGWTLESIREGAGFAAARREWAPLHAASRSGLFNAWEWLYPWYRRLGDGRRLMILTARDLGGELAGVMPLSLSRVSAAGRQLRRLSFLGDSGVGSDYLDVIARAGLEGPMARSFAEAIHAAHDDWDVVDLLDLDEASPTIAAMLEVFLGGGFSVRLSERFVCPFEPLIAGEGVEAFLRRTARRDNYLRRRKWLERQDGYRVEVTLEPGQLAAPLGEFFRLHAARWAPEGGSSGIPGPGVEAFHRDATQYLAERGWLRLYTMRLGAQAVASVYGIVFGGKFLYYQSGLDPAWRDRSVGLVLVGETFRDAIGAGLREYDFLHGVEAYKADWVHQQRRTVSLRIWRRGSRGEWLARSEEASKRLRSAAKRVLPAGVVEAIRRRARRKKTRRR